MSGPPGVLVSGARNSGAAIARELGPLDLVVNAVTATPPSRRPADRPDDGMAGFVPRVAALAAGLDPRAGDHARRRHPGSLSPRVRR